MSANESNINARQCSSEIEFVSPDNVYAVCELLRLQEDAPNFVQFGVFELKSLAKAQETIPELVFEFYYWGRITIALFTCVLIPMGIPKFLTRNLIP